MLYALDERKRAILSAVVESHIGTGEPVGSAAVSHRTDLGLSSATIRNEMSELESGGYLDHPHTSAGRVPTDRGYRVYAEGVIAGAAPASDPGPFARLTQSAETETALETACRLLARLTHYLSLAQPPKWGNERLRHLQLARLDSHRVLAVVLTESGRVHHALLEFDRLPTAGQLRTLDSVINDRFAGRALSALTREALLQAIRELWTRQAFAGAAVEVLSASIPMSGDSPLVIEGGSQLLDASEFQQARVARQVFGLLEEQTYLRGLLAGQSAEIAVTIGEESGHPALRHCALLSAVFRTGGGEGRIGVLGPKRMPYRAVTSMLLLATRALGAALSGR